MNLSAGNRVQQNRSFSRMKLIITTLTIEYLNFDLLNSFFLVIYVSLSTSRSKKKVKAGSTNLVEDVV